MPNLPNITAHLYTRSWANVHELSRKTGIGRPEIELTLGLDEDVEREKVHGVTWYRLKGVAANG